MRIQHALTFDVEDWYQGFIYRQIDGWQKYGSREQQSIQRILDLLSECGTKATFFLLGSYAEQHPEVARSLVAAGHEIATHGYAHVPIPQHTRASFRDDLRRSIDVLQQITGKRVSGHRAASWSVNRSQLWIFETLIEEGIEYDSSVFPTRLHSYGLPRSPSYPYRLSLAPAKSIYEFPAQVLRLALSRVPAAGGFYLRALPYRAAQLALMQSERSGHSGMVYLHPYDIDDQVPRLKVPFAFRVIRYYNLDKTVHRLKKLLASFHFSSLREIIDSLHNTMPDITISQIE